jgi:heme/copper-type cytochrome/quinol oxidase subunit 2
VSAAVVVFAACALCCVVGQVAILRSALRAPSAPADAAVPRPKRFAEIVWALIPAIALALLLTVTWARVRVAATPKPDVTMKSAR